MYCPFCRAEDTRVVDSRLTTEGDKVRRRRECTECGARFNTFESPQLKLPAVVKHDGRREPFSEEKLRGGVRRALEKRPVPTEEVDGVISRIVRDLRAAGRSEVPSLQIGELVMAALRELDQVAYVRFASVYRRFEDVQAFREEIERLESTVPDYSEAQLSLLEGGEDE
jgi:transcriptional repressor NrdR